MFFFASIAAGTAEVCAERGTRLALVNTSSAMATLTEPDYEAFTASKAGIIGTTPEFWQSLQAHYDITMARRALPPEVAEKIVAQRVA